MLRKYRNKGIVTLLLITGVVFATMSFSSEKQPKHNFKVLPQDISRDSLHNLMHSFNVALGVKCDFCHAKSAVDSTKLDFSADGKEEKEAARYMLKMTDSINKQFFSDPKFNPSGAQIVTCVTCHHGSKEPEKQVAEAQ